MRINYHSGVCPCCREYVAPRAPEGLELGPPFGPGLRALILRLHITQAISVERFASLMGEVFGLTIGEGAIANFLARAQTRLLTATARMAAAVRTGPVVGSDQTSARVRGTGVALSPLAELCRYSRGLANDKLADHKRVCTLVTWRNG